MFEITGKYTNALVMIDDVERSCVGQITQMCSHKAFTEPIAIMPDTHAGKGSVIGFTMPLGDKIIPNVVGVDIGCGMLSFGMGKNLFSFQSKEELDVAIRAVVPFGTKVRPNTSKKFTNFAADVDIQLAKMRVEFQKRYNTTVPAIAIGSGPRESAENLLGMLKVVGMDANRWLKSIGTLGGGNHFIEVGKSEQTGEYVITIHSGSRNYGKCVCEFWQKQAVLRMTKPIMSKTDYVQFVKDQFPKRKWESEISKYESQMVRNSHVPKGTEYLESLDMYMYLCHMIIAQTYASWNRKVMMEEICDVIGIAPEWKIETVHNFIDLDDWIIRKGAIRSYIGEQSIIPWNMEDGLVIVEGKSNPDWNCSAPHGAGRLFSRSEAKRTLSLTVAKKGMKAAGVYTSSLPLDEVKAAYKDSAVIESCIEPTATIIDRVRPVLNMKDKK